MIMAYRFSAGVLPLLVFELMALASFICVHVGLCKLLVAQESRGGRNVEEFHKYRKLFAVGDAASVLFQFLAICLASVWSYSCSEVSRQSRFPALFSQDNSCQHFEGLFQAEITLGTLLILVNAFRPLLYRFSCLWTVYEKSYQYPLLFLVAGLCLDLSLPAVIIFSREMLQDAHIFLVLWLSQLVLTTVKWYLWTSTDYNLAYRLVSWLSAFVQIAVYSVHLLRKENHNATSLMSLYMCTYALRTWIGLEVPKDHFAVDEPQAGNSRNGAAASANFGKFASLVILMLVLVLAPEFIMLHYAIKVFHFGTNQFVYAATVQLVLQTAVLLCSVLVCWELSQNWRVRDGRLFYRSNEDQEEEELPTPNIEISSVVEKFFLLIASASIIWSLLHLGHLKDTEFDITLSACCSSAFLLLLYCGCAYNIQFLHVSGFLLYLTFPILFFTVYYDSNFYEDRSFPGSMQNSLSVVCWILVSALVCCTSELAINICYRLLKLACSITFLSNLYVIIFEDDASIKAAIATVVTLGIFQICSVLIPLYSLIKSDSVSMIHTFFLVSNMSFSFGNAFVTRSNNDADFSQEFPKPKFFPRYVGEMHFAAGCFQLCCLHLLTYLHQEQPERYAIRVFHFGTDQFVVRKNTIIILTTAVLEILVLGFKLSTREVHGNIVPILTNTWNILSLATAICILVRKFSGEIEGAITSCPFRAYAAVLYFSICINAGILTMTQIAGRNLLSVDIALLAIIITTISDIFLNMQNSGSASISRFSLHILHGLYLTLVGITVVDYHHDNSYVKIHNSVLLGLEIAGAGLWSAVCWHQGFAGRRQDFRRTLIAETLNGQLLFKFVFHIFGIMWMLQEYGTSNTIVEKTIQIVCVLIKEWLFCCILHLTTEINRLWQGLFLNEAFCCLPPLVAQFWYQRYIGNAFTAITMSGELLGLAFGFGFDHILSSVDRLPARTLIEKTLRLAPTLVMMLITWIINSISLYIDCRLLWYHLVLGFCACLCSSLFSAYFFITDEEGWPRTIVTVCLENIFTGLLLFAICAQGYYMRLCDLSEHLLLKAAFSLHLTCVIALMFCRSWFRSDWRVVQKRLWVPNFIFEAIDLVSVYGLYVASDVDEHWYMWFLFGEFCFNLIIFEVGQNFWKSDYAVGAHVFIFDLVSDIPLIVVVLYRISTTGNNVLADEVGGFPLQAFSFVVNVLILIKSVLAQPIWWWLKEEEDLHDLDTIEANPVPQTPNQQSSAILKGVQVVKLCSIAVGLFMVIRSFDYPGRIVSTLTLQNITTEEFTQMRNVRIFKTVIEKEMSHNSLREAHIQVQVLPKVHAHAMPHTVWHDKSENESWIDLRFFVRTTNTSIQHKFEALVDSGNLSASLNEAGLNVEGVCFLSEPKFIYPQDCGDDAISSGETCDDGNRDSGDGCSDVCQVEHPTKTHPGSCK